MPVGLAVTALFFLVMGIAALVAPARILAPFGVTVATADGRSEVRAVYGGFGVVTGVLLLARRAIRPCGTASCSAPRSR